MWKRVNTLQNRLHIYAVHFSSFWIKKEREWDPIYFLLAESVSEFIVRSVFSGHHYYPSFWRFKSKINSENSSKNCPLIRVHTGQVVIKFYSDIIQPVLFILTQLLVWLVVRSLLAPRQYYMWTVGKEYKLALIFIEVLFLPYNWLLYKMNKF